MVATFIYGLHVKQAYPDFVPARVRVGTFIDAPVSFLVILYLTHLPCRNLMHHSIGFTVRYGGSVGAMSALTV